MSQSSSADKPGASGDLPALDAGGFHHCLQEVPGAAVVLFTRRGCSACHAMGDALRRWQVEGDAPALFVFVDGEYHGPLQTPPRVPLLREALEARLRQPPEEAP